MADSHFKKNSHVWWFDEWGNLHDGKIHAVHKSGMADIVVMGGIITQAPVSECHSTKESCVWVKNQEFKESITDVESLVTFLLSHGRWDGLDEVAKGAAAERAKELLGIDIYDII